MSASILLFPDLRRQMSPRLIARIMARVVKQPDGCWLCGLAVEGGGYCQIRDGAGRKLRVHRLMYEAHVGPVPDGLCVLHRCDVRNCCNPAHLFVGTQADNAADAMAKGRHFCRPLMLSGWQLDVIARSWDSHASLARRLGVSPMTVLRARRRMARPPVASSMQN